MAPIESRTAPLLPSAAERRSRRLTSGMTQEQFSVLLGVSQPTFSRWERDEVRLIGPARRAYAELLRALS